VAGDEECVGTVKECWKQGDQMGRFFTLGDFLISKVAKCFCATFFHRKSDESVLTKTRLDNILGAFSTNSSGHWLEVGCSLHGTFTRAVFHQTKFYFHPGKNRFNGSDLACNNHVVPSCRVQSNRFQRVKKLFSCLARGCALS
jgi:hypothetical protein